MRHLNGTSCVPCMDRDRKLITCNKFIASTIHMRQMMKSYRRTESKYDSFRTGISQLRKKTRRQQTILQETVTQCEGIQ